MDRLELLPLNLQAGYGYKKSQIERGGITQDFAGQGAVLSGDLALSLTFEKEYEADSDPSATEKPEVNRVKYGMDVVTSQADIMVGQARDNYLRSALNFGPYFHGDVTTDLFRYATGWGVTGRWENNRTIVGGQNISGSTWSVAIPLAFGIGTKRIFVQDKLILMIELTPSFKLKNEATVNYRPYANYGNNFLQAVDIFFSCVSELGRITSDTKEKGNLLLAGLRLGLM